MPDVKTVHVNANGKGFALVELAYRYNVDVPDAGLAFLLKPNVQMINEYHLKLDLMVKYQPPEGKKSDGHSNMAVLEVAMPSGFIVNTELLNGLKTTISTIKRIETMNSDTVAIIYFDYFTLDPVTLEIDGFREFEVEEQKSAPIVIYDYYDNGT